MTLKISIVMPTYNDENYIRASLESVLGQRYENWELIIIDDGSTDNTTETVSGFTDDKRIRYFRLEQNKGQLNALYSSINHINGDYVTMLHSDDKFYHSSSLNEILGSIDATRPEGIYSDIYKMNKEGEIVDIVKTPAKIDETTVAAQLALGGSNPVSDVFFVRKDIFTHFVVPRYIQWNLPYYYSVDNNSVRCLNLKKVLPWYAYRVYDENFIRSDSGKFEASNGCIRSSLELLHYYSIPLYHMQALLTRVSLILFNRPIVYYRRKPFHGSYRVFIEYILKNYYPDRSYLDNRYYHALLGFYEKYPSERTIYLDCREESNHDYSGKDARIFYHDIMNDELGRMYEYFLQEAESGFGCIRILEGKCCSSVKQALKFLSLSSNIDALSDS